LLLGLLINRFAILPDDQQSRGPTPGINLAPDRLAEVTFTTEKIDPSGQSSEQIVDVPAVLPSAVENQQLSTEPTPAVAITGVAAIDDDETDLEVPYVPAASFVEQAATITTPAGERLPDEPPATSAATSPADIADTVPVASAKARPAEELISIKPTAIADRGQKGMGPHDPETCQIPPAELSAQTPPCIDGTCQLVAPPTTTESLGTSLRWTDTPADAYRLAKQQHKLVFLIHVSGNFEIPGFT
jgi:hypothetical protein